MPVDGYDNVTLRKAITRRIDQFIEVNDEGYASRPEVINAAVRQFVEAFYARKIKETGLRDRLAGPKSRAVAGRVRERDR